MIVVPSRYPTRNGSGLFGDIFKKVVSKVTNAGVKNTINKVVNSSVAHKVAEAVVNGAVSGTEKLVDKTIADLKRSAPVEEEIPKKKLKIDISNIINGKGIVLD